MGRRILSAVVLIPSVVAVLWFDPLQVGVFLLTGLLTGGMLIEYRTLANERGARIGVVDVAWMWLVALGWMAADVGWLGPRLAEPAMFPGVGLLLLVLGSFVGVWWRGRPEGVLLHAGAVVLGGVLLGWCFGHYALLVHGTSGAPGLIIVLGTVWMCDTGAYIVGRQFGRHTMSPLLSPRKTWEGAFAGWVASVVACVFLTRWLGDGSTLTAAIIGAVIGVTAQLSDLAESALKRDAAVKDSGSLIPGHGGLLDRTDSLVLTLPVVYYLSNILSAIGVGA